jgi:hypothetical protein
MLHNTKDGWEYRSTAALQNKKGASPLSKPDPNNIITYLELVVYIGGALGRSRFNLFLALIHYCMVYTLLSLFLSLAVVVCGLLRYQI